MDTLIKVTCPKTRGDKLKYSINKKIIAFSRTVNCLDFLDSGDLVAGDDFGKVRSYSVSAEGEYFKSHEFEAHPKGVNGIMVLEDGIVVTGGDKDRKICAWDSARNFGKRGEAKIPDGIGAVRSFCKHSVNQVKHKKIKKHRFQLLYVRFTERWRFVLVFLHNEELHFRRCRLQEDLQN